MNCNSKIPDQVGDDGLELFARFKQRLKEIGFNRSRELTGCRDVARLTQLRFLDDVVFIPSFCSIDIGESLFHDAKTYFYSLTRNIEAFSEIAARLKDKVFVTQNEVKEKAKS